MRLPDKEFVHSYILMKYRPYSLRKKSFCVWDKMSHSNPFRVIFDYLKIFWKINFTGSSKGRTRDFDSRNLGSNPSPVTNEPCEYPAESE